MPNDFGFLYGSSPLSRILVGSLFNLEIDWKGIVEANATDHSFLLYHNMFVLCPKIKRTQEKEAIIVRIEIYSRLDLDGASELMTLCSTVEFTLLFHPPFPFVHKKMEERMKEIEHDRGSEKMVVSCKKKWVQSDFGLGSKWMTVVQTQLSEFELN